MPTNAVEGAANLTMSLPHDQLPYTLRQLHSRASEKSPRSTDFFDYLGLATKLLWLLHSGAFEQDGVPGLDPAQLLVPGRVSVLDVSVANDLVKNLVTADMLRKIFAYKMTQEKTPPTLLVVEEAHSFISREKVSTMQATMQMLQNVTRRGRKRWLACAFVSQQPGHLPPEIFELCNTRIVHTLHSMHNLDTLMATTSDISKELWEKCPLLSTGEAIISSPQLKHPLVTNVRLAHSHRKFMS
jgi:DNA helicase HerA-like ATPase